MEELLSERSTTSMPESMVDGKCSECRPWPGAYDRTIMDMSDVLLIIENLMPKEKRKFIFLRTIGESHKPGPNSC